LYRDVLYPVPHKFLAHPVHGKETALVRKYVGLDDEAAADWIR
jgi:hypothetical protein